MTQAPPTVEESARSMAQRIKAELKAQPLRSILAYCVSREEVNRIRARLTLKEDRRVRFVYGNPANAGTLVY